MKLLARVVSVALVAKIQNVVHAALQLNQIRKKRVVVVEVLELIAWKLSQRGLKLVYSEKVVVVKHRSRLQSIQLIGIAHDNSDLLHALLLPALQRRPILPHNSIRSNTPFRRAVHLRFHAACRSVFVYRAIGKSGGLHQVGEVVFGVQPFGVELV
ncbi:Uncharacterised protein [uncultured archaeon]|nr:Uncharacterised protein [uncultured archaeon]